ncbi:alpha/beta fold hydrolase [Terricaulis sp.]|uniref:alpha/beta fold hydrolase n=1 Tax=Terricaulis sp. TaxID=2768686 RepID=UPI0037847EA0
MDSAGGRFIGGYEERVVSTVDGLTIYVREYAPLAPVTGLPVICLHGLTRNSRDFEVIGPRIAALGRRVIAPDMRGRGRSANDNDPDHYVPAVYSQDVISILDKLETPRAVFLGTSMGGLITMLTATIAPDRVAASIINDIGPKVETEGLAKIATYIGRGLPLPSWAAAAQAVRDTVGDAYPERVHDDAFWDTFARRTFRELDDGRVEADYDPNIALTFADPETTPVPDLTPLFQAIAGKPLLSVHGEISNILSADGVAVMRGLKPDLHTVEVPNVGHAPCLDEPEAWDAILDFLARVE